MTEFYDYCQSCDRNSIHWLMFDINFHQLLAADEVIGNVVVMNMHMTVAVVQIVPKFCFLVFSGGLADWLLF
jgi:hypothetical protein